MLIEAYSPLGNNQTGEPRTVDDAKVKEIASKLGKDGGQLLASWGIQRGTVVLPKSVTDSRIRSNLEGIASTFYFMVDFCEDRGTDSPLVFEIPEEDMAELDNLERQKRFNFPAHWGFNIFEEAGDAVVRKAALRWAEKNKLA